MERELRVSRAPSCHRALPRATFSLGGAQAWGTRNTTCWFPGPGKGMPETPLLWGHAALGDGLGAPRRPLLTVQGGEGVGTHALHSDRPQLGSQVRCVELRESHIAPQAGFLTCRMGYRSTCATWGRCRCCGGARRHTVSCCC